jgi:hypothetical protein
MTNEIHCCYDIKKTFSNQQIDYFSPIEKKKSINFPRKVMFLFVYCRVMQEKKTQ